jgi:glycosyltransferase involved in cell wall biosynthesis
MKICFLGNISSALLGNAPGGGELQSALLAKALAKSGNEIVIIDPESQKSFKIYESIQVVSIPNWNSGIRIIRMITHRIPFLYKNLVSQKADIYYTRTKHFFNFLSYLAARKVGAKFIYAVASDLDVLGLFKRIVFHYFKSVNLYNLFASTFLTELSLQYILSHADIVLVQHEFQRKELLKKKIESYIFKNIIDTKSIIENKPLCEKDGYTFIGSLDVRKGLKEFIEVVRKVREKKFNVIGQPRGRGAERLFKELQLLPNVIIFGRLNHKEAIKIIAKSKAVICTSPFEGFPNIFLEAWCVGTPVISLVVNPEFVISKEKLGIVCDGHLDEMINNLKEENFYFDSKKLREYVIQNHSFELADIKFHSILSFKRNEKSRIFNAE